MSSRPITTLFPDCMYSICRAVPGGALPNTWPTFASPQADIPRIPDPAVMLIAWLVGLLRVEVEKVESTRGLDERVSPLVSEKLLWAIARIAGSYMWCQDAGQWIAQAMDGRIAAVLVNAACVYLSFWGTQGDVVKEANMLLLTLPSRVPADAMADTITSLPAWKSLVGAHMSSCNADVGWAPLDVLEPRAHGELCSTLIRSSSADGVQLMAIVGAANSRLTRVCQKLSQIAAEKEVPALISRDIERLAALHLCIAESSLNFFCKAAARWYFIVLEAWTYAAGRCLGALESSGARGERTSLWLTISAMLKLFGGIVENQLMSCEPTQTVLLLSAVAKIIEAFARCDSAMYSKHAPSADDDAAARADDFACLFRILVAVADFSFGDDVTFKC